MPAIMDDPASPPIIRTAGHNPGQPLPTTIKPRLVTLRDGQRATILPFVSALDIPLALMALMSKTFNAEIEAGDTYPMLTHMPLSQFASYWLQNFAAVMLIGNWTPANKLQECEQISQDSGGAQPMNYEEIFCGTYYIKPNYPGRSGHISNAGFLVAPKARGKGGGRLLGESYLDYAPKLGFEYSVFNLVYDTNVASTKIWDALGFDRVGRIPRCGNLRSFPGRNVDAIVYGRGFGKEGDEKFVGNKLSQEVMYYGSDV